MTETTVDILLAEKKIIQKDERARRRRETKIKKIKNKTKAGEKRYKKEKEIKRYIKLREKTF
jgi:hypothetical protein